MAKLHQAVQAHSPSQNLIRKVIGQKAYDKAHFIGTDLTKAATPEPTPAAIPLPDEDAIQRAKRKATAAQLGRTGRASTILTDNTTDRLGP